MADKLQNVRAISSDQSVFVFDTCCCCIPLKVGCLILGYSQLVGLAVSAVYSVIGIIGGLLFIYHIDAYNPGEFRRIGLVLLISNAISLLLDLFTLAFNVLLLIGLHKNKRSLIKIYLIYAVVHFVLFTLGYIGTIAARYTDPYGIGITIASLHIVFAVYYLLVLRSHWLKLGGSTTHQPTHHNRDDQQVTSVV